MPHIHSEPGQLDLTVEVFIVLGDRVLLRCHDKFGIWLSVGGHVELEEDPPEAALREVREEVGLDVVLYDANMRYRESSDGYIELPPPMFMCRVRVGDTHEHLTMTYVARATTDAVVPSGPDRSDTWRWFTRGELSDASFDIKPSIRFYAETALDTVGVPI